MTPEIAAALACIDECDNFVETLCPAVQEVMSLYDILGQQVIVAGMGDVIGINHLALYPYLDMMGYSEHTKRRIFHALVKMHALEWHYIRKYRRKD